MGSSIYFVQIMKGEKIDNEQKCITILQGDT